MAVLGLHCFVRVFLSCGKQRLLCGVWVSHCGDFSSCRAQALGTRVSENVEHGLGCCGLWALEWWLLALIAAWHVGGSYPPRQQRSLISTLLKISMALLDCFLIWILVSAYLFPNILGLIFCKGSHNFYRWT